VWETWNVDPSPGVTGRMAALLYERFLRTGGKVDRGTVEKYLRLVG